MPVRQRTVRNVLLTTIIGSVTLYFLLRSQGSAYDWSLPDFEDTWDRVAKPISGLLPAATATHPIDKLVQDAITDHERLLAKRTQGVAAAAAAYRLRRGRHPPPRFEKWVELAESRGALIIEDFFDQLYTDVDPFWGVAPSELRKFPASWPFTISIRNGTVRRWSNEPAQGFLDFMTLWRDGIKGIPNEDLPDVDLAFNSDDETHMFVPYERMQKHIADGEARKSTTPPTAEKPMITEFTSYPMLPLTRPTIGNGSFNFEFYSPKIPLWEIARETCPPGTEARYVAIDTDYTTPAQFPTQSLDHMYKGYISNWSQAKSACANPHLRDVHGSFVGMQTFSINADKTTLNYDPKQRAIITRLVPLLSGCKIHDMNYEILIPPGVHWEDKNPTVNVQEDFRVEWEEKKNVVMWRGTASGGINTKENWTRFHRHRFIAMTNGSLVAEHQRVAHEPLPAHVPGGNPVLPHHFPLPNPSIYPLAVLQDTIADLAEWINHATDSAFTALRCWPGFGPQNECSYNDRWYSTVGKIPGNALWQYKVLPDLDGASYSGRFRAFLQSGSLPVKATIYDEWSDSRLIPWRHFVPMDNTFMDWWGLLEYFLGYKDRVESRDDVARGIAEASKDWAERVLRREDMEVYMYRLILELARVSDDKRDSMGFVADLDYKYV